MSTGVIALHARDLSLGAAGDLLLVHKSSGRYDQGWRRYADRFFGKHALDTVTEPSAGPFYEAALRQPSPQPLRRADRASGLKDC
jgi:hypothetical protein